MPQYLFRPINALSRGLRSSKQQKDNVAEKDDARVSSSSQEENLNPTKKKDASASTTVSPPLDEAEDPAEQQNGKTSEQMSEDVHEETDDTVATAARRPRKKRRNELDDLAAWAVSADGNNGTKSTRSSRSTGVSVMEKLPVTPSPSRKRRVANLKVEGMNQQEGNDADNIDVPRKRAASKKVVLKAEPGDAVVVNSPANRKRGRQKEVSASNSDVVEQLLPKKRRGRPPKSATTKAKLKTERIVRKMPRRNATKTQQESYVYFSEDESDGDNNDEEDFGKKLTPKKKAPRRGYTKRAGKRARKRAASDSSDEVEDVDSDESSQDNGTYKSGPWSKKEKLSFLLGLKVCGRSWTDIAARFVPTRSNKQVKWYGGRLIDEAESKGGDIYSPLRANRTLVRKILSERNDDEMSDSDECVENLYDEFCLSDDEEEEADDKDEEERKNQEGKIPWSDEENLLFLYGLKCLGRAKWQQLHEEFLPTRSRHSIRGHAQKYMKRQDLGEDIFVPLKGKEDLLEGLMSMSRPNFENAVSVPATPPGKKAVAARSPPSKPEIISRVYNNPKSYNASIIGLLASAKVTAGEHEAALNFCRDTLTSWYDDAEEAIESHTRRKALDSTNIRRLRNEIAKLWCIYARLIGTISQKFEGVQNLGWTKLAVEVLDVARSCPFVGNCHEIIQARLVHEFGELVFLETVDSDTLGGFAKAMESVEVEKDKIRMILSTSIAVCNDAVRKLPGDRCFSLDAKLNSMETNETNESEDPAGRQQRYLITTLTAALAHRVELLRSSWRSSLHVVDEQSTLIICKEANRLSRISEALISKDNNPLGTEYGCGCCWSIFSTERELLEHQKSCHGNATAAGEHEQVQRVNVSNCRPARSMVGFSSELRKVIDLKKPDENGVPVPRNAPTRPYCEVEYGCSHHGCSRIFGTEKELVDHQNSCGHCNGVVSRPPPPGNDAGVTGEHAI